MSHDSSKPTLLENLISQKKWWITPLLIIAILIIALIVFGKNPEIAPFLYERF
jgi:hypothetical protein